jgi:HK97 family phage portal protein
MKKLNWIQKAAANLFQLPVPINPLAGRPLSMNNPRFIGNELTVYPQDSGERYITKGYNLNDGVFSIVSKNAEKAGQIRMYHAKIKRNERKTLQEYNALQKGAISEKMVKELSRMRKAMTEDYLVDSPLTKLLNRPTRYQTQSEWIEQLVALRELQGEGNIWKSRGEQGGKPLELLVIPKPHLNLIGNPDNPWDIKAYQFNLNGALYNWKKEDVLMWKYTNPTSLSNTFEHMRGLAPLSAAMILLQGMNEGDLRIATSNKNAGAYGFAFRKDMGSSVPTAAQIGDMRTQFDGIINSGEMAGKVAILSGEWGYYNIGVSVEAQKLLEQYGYGFKRLCRVFKTPAGIFDEGNATWDNQKQFYRQWVYSKIAPMIYQLRGMLSDSLLPDFGLDPEYNLIDCDVASLPELSQDLEEMSAGLEKVHGLTIDQRLQHFGYEPIGGKAGSTILIPSGFQTLDDLTLETGGNLDEEINQLED